MGLGSTRDVTLDEARDAAIDANRLIAKGDVLDIIKPIWLAAPVAARDARTQLESILSATKAAGHRTGENPAAWKDNLKRLRRALCSGWSAC
jgi:hypothetical protein